MRAAAAAAAAAIIISHKMDRSPLLVATFRAGVKMVT